MISKHRGYLISPAKASPSLVTIATEGRGGKIPNSLTGMYTSVGLAKLDIDRYLESKGKEDAKTSNEGGS